MILTRSDVHHIATLAELAVADEDLDLLTAQLDRIVGFVGQLDALPESMNVDPFHLGPSLVRLRDDVVRPAALAHLPAAIAPAFHDGFFLVPRVVGMDEA